MSFVSSLFGEAPKAAQIDKGATTAQATQLYGQVQGGIDQQQSFVNAVNAQNGLGNQNSVYQQLAGIANGTGPTVAQNQLNQATGQNVANQAALAAGVRGSSQNAGLIARQAALSGANIQQQAAGQAATLRAQEQQGAIGQMGGIATNQVNQQQGALQNLNSFTQGAQSNVLGAINGQNKAAVDMQNGLNDVNQKRNQMVGSALTGAIGGAAPGIMSMLKSAAPQAAQAFTAPAMAGGMDSFPGTTMRAAHGGMIPNHGRFVEAWNKTHGLKSDPKMMSDGGQVPGQPLKQGDSLKNDTQPTMLSPGEVVIPRSVMMSKDPVKAASEFVAKVIAGKGPQPKEIPQGQALSSGGDVESVFAPIKPGPGMSSAEEVPDYTYHPTPWDINKNTLTEHLPNAIDSSSMSFDPAQASKDAQADFSFSGIGKPQSQDPQIPMMAGDKAPQGMSQGPTAPQAPQGTQGQDDPYGFGALAGAQKAGYGQQMLGIKQMGDAEAMAAQGQSKAADEMIKQTQDNQAKYQEHYAALESDRQNFQKQLAEGKIDPDHYLGSMSGGQHIGTAIGLILGGLAAGTNGGHNPALEFLNKQIDRDIEGQKANMGKTENLLKANMAQFGNLRDAENMTRTQLADIYAAKIQKAGAEAGTTAAQARANQAAGALTSQAAPLFQQTAMRQAMLGGGMNDPEKMMQYYRITDPEKAKEMEQRYVPGIGIGSVPVSEAARKEIVSRQQLSNKLSDLEQFAKQHSGTVMDRQTVNKGKALAADAQNLMRQANSMGVFREGEQGFVESMIKSDPSAFMGSFRTIPGYQQIRKGNDSALDATLRAHGLHRPQVNFQKAN